jgi:5-formyltetrahydrofolate cyclo-ligase
MPLDEQTDWVENRFKIPEPRFEKNRLIAPELLDLVITPLLAFDGKGHRIGMGAGFYDRTFSFLNRSPRPSKPLLCGLAYAFQQVADTEPEGWDVSLDYVVTEEGVMTPV